MGVPVVTLVGECHAGRVGHSLLSRVDLPHCAARDEDAYVHTAISLASDAETLRQLRDGLRARMRASALCDGARLARALENEYQRLCRELT
jgi:predicted O-linked N-acetylglucosamine transferase (SPINDLY family)